MLRTDQPDALADRHFDVIVSTDVLEHLTDPERAVRDLIDCLAPGGLLVLTVTFYTNEQGPFHLNCDRYTNESFYGIVKGMGMEELTRFSPRVFRKTEKNQSPVLCVKCRTGVEVVLTIEAGSRLLKLFEKEVLDEAHVARRPQ